MGEYSDIFVGLDVAKDRHAVAIAKAGRDGDLRCFGEIGSDTASMRFFVRKLADPGRRLRFCYEAGPTDYGLEREIEALGHECVVIAPSLIPRRTGDPYQFGRPLTLRQNTFPNHSCQSHRFIPDKRRIFIKRSDSAAPRPKTTPILSPHKTTRNVA